jgi:uncharacterized membrane protein YgdD (TMEM256/DUF423 family)
VNVSQSPQSLGRNWLIAAGLLGSLGVVFGAFGAHGLEGWLESTGLDSETTQRRLAQMDTAVRYHLLHAAALLALAALAPQFPSRWIRVAGWLFVIGVILFSGSLYVLIATNQPKWGAVTPLGGLAWIVGWLFIAMCGFLCSRSGVDK